MSDKERYYRAIRDLPEEWVSEETRLTVWDEKHVYAANPNFPAMRWTPEKKWEVLEFTKDD